MMVFLLKWSVSVLLLFRVSVRLVLVSVVFGRWKVLMLVVNLL